MQLAPSVARAVLRWRSITKNRKKRVDKLLNMFCQRCICHNYAQNVAQLQSPPLLLHVLLVCEELRNIFKHIFKKAPHFFFSSYPVVFAPLGFSMKNYTIVAYSNVFGRLASATEAVRNVITKMRLFHHSNAT